jgi:hypothetical protein
VASTRPSPPARSTACSADSCGPPVNRQDWPIAHGNRIPVRKSPPAKGFAVSAARFGAAAPCEPSTCFSLPGTTFSGAAPVIAGNAASPSKATVHRLFSLCATKSQPSG